MKNIQKLALAAAFLSYPSVGATATISIDAFGDAWEVYNFRVVTGLRSWGEPGDFIAFGFPNVVPNGYGGTTATATQNGVSVDLSFQPQTNQPNRFAGGIDYDPSLTGSWKITLRNETDSLVINTPEIGSAPVQGAVSALKMSGNQLAPTIKWTNPNIEQEVQINIFDLGSRLSNTDEPNRIYANRLGSDFSEFTIPNGLLLPDHLYSIGIETGTVRGSGINPSGTSQASAYLSSRYTFFDFSTGVPPTGDGIYLPVVDPNSGQPIFNFNNPVLAGLISYYDPTVAIGYDYTIGEGNPLFKSVLLPNVGDGIFDLYLDSGAGFSLFDTILAGIEYDFGEFGASAFRILGIETEAGLDPMNPNAFVTGLSFLTDGQFTGQMRPISMELAAVPLPVSFSGMAAALLGLVLLALHGKRNQTKLKFRLRKQYELAF